MPEALPYFEGRLLIFAPNIRQGKCFFGVLVCCMTSAVYLAGQHVKKSKIGRGEDSTLLSVLLTPKAVKFLQILLKLYKISLHADLTTTV